MIPPTSAYRVEGMTHPRQTCEWRGPIPDSNYSSGGTGEKISDYLYCRASCAVVGAALSGTAPKALASINQINQSTSNLLCTIHKSVAHNTPFQPSWSKRIDTLSSIDWGRCCQPDLASSFTSLQASVSVRVANERTLKTD